MKALLTLIAIATLFASYNGRPATHAAEFARACMQATVHDGFMRTQADMFFRGLSAMAGLVDGKLGRQAAAPVKQYMLVSHDQHDQDPEHYYVDGGFIKHDQE